MLQPEPQRSPESLAQWWGLREVDHLFSRLGRYTRFVLYGKWSLLVIAVLLMVSLIGYPLLTKDESGVRVSFVDSKSTTAVAPTSPVMNNPEYRGVNAKGAQYKVSGITATQKTPQLIVLDKVQAELLRLDGSWYSLTADTAEYMKDTEIVELIGNVVIIDSAGNNYTTPRATVETQTSRIHGKDGIVAVGNKGNLVASSFEISDNGDRMVFMRGDAPVKLTITKSAGE